MKSNLICEISRHLVIYSEISKCNSEILSFTVRLNSPAFSLPSKGFFRNTVLGLLTFDTELGALVHGGHHMDLEPNFNWASKVECSLETS